MGASHLSVDFPWTGVIGGSKPVGKLSPCLPQQEATANVAPGPCAEFGVSCLLLGDRSISSLCLMTWLSCPPASGLVKPIGKGGRC